MTILLINNQSLVIASNSENETVYLLALLNAPLNRLVLEKNLRQEAEKDFLVSIKSIKEYIRVPQVSTENGKRIKEEIVACTKALLSLEEKTLSDFVDFSQVLTQKLDSVSVANGYLVLKSGDRELKLGIGEKADLVTETICKSYPYEVLEPSRRSLSLHELRNLKVIDKKKQSELKQYVDDLVYALYFNVPLKQIGLRRRGTIKKACLANQHYEYVLKG